MSYKSHWEKIYATKRQDEVSWYQPTPRVSLDFISELNIQKDAAIIDIGGGDSHLADNLLAAGFTDITVLDISEEAINKAKQRLGKEAERVKWIVSDINEFVIDKKFDCWHDRAAFHFLTTEEQVEKYLSIAQEHISKDGRMIIGTFSTSGPEKCSGLPIKQYSEQSLSAVLKNWFKKIKCITTNHVTPFNTIQNFLFCSFKKINFQ
jgi:ubiquinone/menaquinone biosynthesis C-methylase UbiE